MTASGLVTDSPSGETHYVLLVHGTFAAPVKDHFSWYQEGDNASSTFAQRLNEKLESAGIGPAALRRCGELSTEFEWTGDNTHEARLEGGEKLFEKIRQIVAIDPKARIHIVAHSHGGNVTLRAIELYLETVLKDVNKIPAALDGRLLMGAGGAAAVEKALVSVVGPKGVTLTTRKDISEWREAVDSFRSSHRARYERDRQSRTPARLPLAVTSPAQKNPREDFHRLCWRLFWRATRKWRKLERSRLKLERLPSHQILSRVRCGGPGRMPAEFVRWRIELLLLFGSRPPRVENLPKPNLDMGALTFDHEVNRLGRIVFLGTPFYEKSYGPEASRVASWIWWLFDIALLTAQALIFFYITFLVWWVILWICFQGLSFPRVRLNPLHWYSWAQIVMGLWCFVIGIQTAERWSPTAKNMYFEGKKLKDVWGKVGGFAYRPIQALVVSAGMLDEVFMAMSSEPLLYGILSPTIGDWLGAVPGLRVRKFSDRVRNMSHRIALAAMGLLGQLITYLPRLTLYLFRRRLMRKVDDRLLSLLTSAGFGVPILEFDNAQIKVMPAPRSIACLGTHFWDVSHYAAAPSFITASKDAGATNAARYAFLWNNETRASQLKESRLWKRIEPRLADIEKRYANATESMDEIKKRLALVSLTLEERLKEAMGAVDLAHSSYYSSPRMLEAISDFIAAGTAPGAEEIRTDTDDAIPSVEAST